MTEKITIGIIGYGNLGRGVELALRQTDDLELVAVFTRRPPGTVELACASTPVYHMDDVADFQKKIDVMILCGGSKDDLPVQTPALAALFNTVDSFDTHARIPEYFESVDQVAQKAGTTAIISVGWDPGLFSINRLYGEAILPVGKTYTFWGAGLSQGHSDAIRRVPGVKAGVQYTIPVQAAVDQVRSGSLPELSTREKHRRQCFIVLEEGADAAAIEQTIATMPDYFADYDTTCEFISMATLEKDHATMPHGGFVIRSGTSGESTKQVIEYSLKLESNPEFTASVLVAYARAAHRLHLAGQCGAKTPLDIAPGLLSPKSPAQLRQELL